MPKSYYEILEVSSDASEDAIRRAYRKKIREFHPDLNPEMARAHRRSRELNIALEVLTDFKKRKRYNEQLNRTGKKKASQTSDEKGNQQSQSKNRSRSGRDSPAQESKPQPTTASKQSRSIRFPVFIVCTLVATAAAFFFCLWAFFQTDPGGLMAANFSPPSVNKPEPSIGQSSDLPESSGTESKIAKIENRLNSIIQKQESRIAQLERLQNKSIDSVSIPVGSIVPYAGNTAPGGWLECDGSSFDSTEFPRLRKLLGSSKLPDLRGEFVRGWDHGKGIDSGRDLLSPQEQELLKHKHSIATANGNDQGYPGNNNHFAIRTTDRHQRNEAGKENHLVLPIGGTENRPRNVALMFVIKTD